MRLLQTGLAKGERGFVDDDEAFLNDCEADPRGREGGRRRAPL